MNVVCGRKLNYFLNLEWVYHDPVFGYNKSKKYPRYGTKKCTYEDSNKSYNIDIYPILKKDEWDDMPSCEIERLYH
jgi:hypothetical protein